MLHPFRTLSFGFLAFALACSSSSSRGMGGGTGGTDAAGGGTASGGGTAAGGDSALGGAGGSVVPAELSLASAPSPVVWNMAYDEPLAVTEATTTWSWALAPGAALPEGLSLLPNGRLQGRTLEVGDFEIDLILTGEDGSLGKLTLQLEVERRSWIAYAVSDASTTRVSLVLVDLSREPLAPVTVLTSEPGGYGPSRLSFSPDGRRVATVWRPGTTAAELRVVDLEATGNLTAELVGTEPVSEYCNIQWNPSGTKLNVVRLPAQGVEAVSVSDFSGSTPNTHTFAAEGTTFSGVYPQGWVGEEQLIWSGWADGTLQIYTFAAGVNGIAGFHMMPEFSYVRAINARTHQACGERGADTTYHCVDFDDAWSRQLPKVTVGTSQLRPSHSPDLAWVAYAVDKGDDDGTGTRIFSMDALADASPAPLLEGLGTVYNANGTYQIYWVPGESPRAALWSENEGLRVGPIEAGATWTSIPGGRQEIVQPGGSSWLVQPGPDRSSGWEFFRLRDSASFQVMAPPEPGTNYSRPLISPAGDHAAFGWTPTASGIYNYYLGALNADGSTGPATLLSPPVGESALISGVATDPSGRWTADGSYFAYVMTGVGSDDRGSGVWVTAVAPTQGVPKNVSGTTNSACQATPVPTCKKVWNVWSQRD